MQNNVDLLEQFKGRWLENKLPAGRPVMLAVSGGEDSMVMADLFLKSKIAFAVAHCNFGLRAEDADLDEQLVANWCEGNDIKFHRIKFDTKQTSLEWKKGIQETARILRYDWFEKVREEYNYTLIVTAHHANDNVETLLINLFKSTGISGLHGILPANGHVVRPLLFATKAMLRSYAAEHKIPYREDSSNDTDDYLRNAVRHNIVPVIEQWFPSAVNSVNESITRFAQAEVLYKKSIQQERQKLLEQRGQDYYIPLMKLKLREPLATICYELLAPFGFTPSQLPHILNLLNAQTGHYIYSPSHRAIRNRDFLVITTLPADGADLIVIETPDCIVDTGKYSFSFSVQPKPGKISADPNIACLDLKNLEFPLLLRKWHAGDYFYPIGMKMKKKKISRLLIDEKVALHDKEEIRILESSKRIAWVSGIRPDERFKVKENTKEVLVVQRELLKTS